MGKLPKASFFPHSRPRYVAAVFRLPFICSYSLTCFDTFTGLAPLNYQSCLLVPLSLSVTTFVASKTVAAVCSYVGPCVYVPFMAISAIYCFPLVVFGPLSSYLVRCPFWVLEPLVLPGSVLPVVQGKSHPSSWALTCGQLDPPFCLAASPRGNVDNAPPALFQPVALQPCSFFSLLIPGQDALTCYPRTGRQRAFYEGLAARNGRRWRCF